MHSYRPQFGLHCGGTTDRIGCKISCRAPETDDFGWQRTMTLSSAWYGSRSEQTHPWATPPFCASLSVHQIATFGAHCFNMIMMPSFRLGVADCVNTVADKV